MRRLALRCALSQRVRENNIRLVENLTMDGPKTKAAVALLKALGAGEKALIVTPDLDRNVYLSARNLPGTETTFVGQLNIYDVLSHRVLVMPVESARRLEQKLAPAAKASEPATEPAT
jgi:large subunit ribosomal protein L4